MFVAITVEPPGGTLSRVRPDGKICAARRQRSRGGYHAHAAGGSRSQRPLCVFKL